ncbi:SdrD B-like domain-containing protein, partial [Pseudomonas sp. K5]|uniref:SdrD B-like domain-containing protein n=1 Tax=Pseudomonas sp. K5 TaxID=1156313 RepID=UPI0018667790
TIAMTVGSEGFYQFAFAPAAPARCEFQLTVTPPGGYTFVSTMIPPQAGALSPAGRAGANHVVQPNTQAPTGAVGTATQYYLTLFAGSATAAIVHNHLPLDTAVATGLAITKTGDRQTAEIGDTVQYTITVRQTAGSALAALNVIDRLPRGFTYIDGTARADGRAVADPTGKPGPLLGFALGPINVGGQIVLTYRVRVGVGAQQGDGINRAQAHGCSINGGCIDPVAVTPLPGSLASNRAEYRVRVTGGVFTEQACVLGKVFMDCNNNHLQDREELGIPGVRLYFSDGTWVISDSEGKYSFCGLPPESHTLKVDASTLPVGARLTTSSNRNLGDADSLLLDLKNGELHRADFIEGSCANPVLEQVKARRTQGEVQAPETEPGQAPLRFESKPARAPQQATDTANQRPIVHPRAT